MRKLLGSLKSWFRKLIETSPSGDCYSGGEEIEMGVDQAEPGNEKTAIVYVEAHTNRVLSDEEVAEVLKKCTRPAVESVPLKHKIDETKVF